MDGRGRIWFERAVFSFVVVVTIYFFLQILPYFTSMMTVMKMLLVPIGIASFIAYLLHPLVLQIERFGLSRTVAVIIIFLAILSVIAFLFAIGLPTLVKQVELALKYVPKQLKELELLSNRFQAQVNTLPSPLRAHTIKWLDQLESFSASLVEEIEHIALLLVRSTLAIIVIPIIVFYILKDMDTIKKTAWYVTPRNWRRPLQHFIKDVDKTFGRFIRGQLLVSAAVAVIAMIGLAILGVPYPIMLGLFIGIADLIPYFGSFLGAIPAAIVAWLESWKLAVMTIVFIFILQQIEGNVLAPYIVGKTLALHPLLIIIALLVGVEIGGVIGLLLAVPILAIGKVMLEHVSKHLFYH